MCCKIAWTTLEGNTCKQFLTNPKKTWDRMSGLSAKDITNFEDTRMLTLLKLYRSKKIIPSKFLTLHLERLIFKYLT